MAIVPLKDSLGTPERQDRLAEGPGVVLSCLFSLAAVRRL